MATFNKFDSFTEAIAEKVHNLGSDVIKVMLTNSAPSASNTVKANLTDIAAGNGYTAGGTQSAQVTSAQTAGVYKLVLTDVVFTATGGSIGAFRYVVLYNDTATNKELIGYYDYGSAITLNTGETFTVDFDATNGVIQLQ
ncbi:hypothetical protein UFOVP69_57 [uncultured Caudovirales phage]|uniref:Uncharacterized protein n=3 Tax=uncultured Caudovirales phage TaxID=2100421 RepID=A0A6J5KZ07_9CAUD|nr:hypothetical protein UFOVP69_57 [uncultured Caudovirales phage]